MGLPAEFPVTPIRAATDRPGIALVSAITGLVLVGTIAAAMWTVVEFDRTSSDNRSDAARAQLLAEAAVAHVRTVVAKELTTVLLTQLIDGADGIEGSSDDGLLVGYGLSSADEIPATGVSLAGGSYFVEILPAPGTTGSTQRALARCTGVTDRNASATIDVVLTATSLPGVVTGGNLTINGNPSILGACGGVHAQGNVTILGNSATIDQYVEAEGFVVGAASNSSGESIPHVANADYLPIPSIDIAGHCANADYYLGSDGKVYDADSVYIAGTSASVGWNGWKHQGGEWTISGGTPPTGTYCIDDDVKISGNPTGTVTLISTGEIDMSGTPQLTAANEKGLLFAAAGEVEVSGNATGSTTNYSGLIYSGAGCAIRGNPAIEGQIVCRGLTEVQDSADASSVTGNVDIQFECGGFFESRKSMTAWYAVFGQ